MSTSHAPVSSAPGTAAERSTSMPRLGPVLVATDGTEDSLPAIHMARLLAEQGASIDVVAVVEPLVLPSGDVVVNWAEVDEERRKHLRRTVEEQVATAARGVTPASVEVILGLPVSEISGMARRRHAALVVTGLRHHGRMERVFLRGETPLRIARAAQRPVLVVPSDVDRLPEIVVITTDLGEASINAARLARPLLAAAKVVHVLHARALTLPEVAAGSPWDRAYADVTRAHVERLIDALGLPANVRIETRTLTGHPVDEILEYAEFVRAELIVSGYHRRVLLDRIVGPRSVAERVYRGTRCAMLLVPELARTVEAGALRTDVFTRADDWAAPLAKFSKQNAGRVAALEVDTETIGAQASVAGAPLRAIDFEPGSDTLRVIFAAREDAASHFVHSIDRPRSVEVYRGDDGTDRALRITHDDGYTLLTFAPAANG